MSMSFMKCDFERYSCAAVPQIKYVYNYINISTKRPFSTVYAAQHGKFCPKLMIKYLFLALFLCFSYAFRNHFVDERLKTFLNVCLIFHFIYCVWPRIDRSRNTQLPLVYNKLLYIKFRVYWKTFFFTSFKNYLLFSLYSTGLRK